MPACSQLCDSGGNCQSKEKVEVPDYLRSEHAAKAMICQCIRRDLLQISAEWAGVWSGVECSTPDNGFMVSGIGAIRSVVIPKGTQATFFTQGFTCVVFCAGPLELIFGILCCGARARGFSAVLAQLSW